MWTVSAPFFGHWVLLQFDTACFPVLLVLSFFHSILALLECRLCSDLLILSGSKHSIVLASDQGTCSEQDESFFHKVTVNEFHSDFDFIYTRAICNSTKFVRKLITAVQALWNVFISVYQGHILLCAKKSVWRWKHECGTKWNVGWKSWSLQSCNPEW